MMEQLGLKESDVKNPALSSTYRGSEIPKPNLTVLDAQARVCTGPTQTRPLSEEQAFKVFDTILRSGKLFRSPNLDLIDFDRFQFALFSSRPKHSKVSTFVSIMLLN
jgi:hypothetical protein